MPPKSSAKAASKKHSVDTVETPPGSPKTCSSKMTPPSPTKKYKTGKPNPKPKSGNSVITFTSSVPEVLLHVCTNNKTNFCSFTNPMMVAWEESDNNSLSDKWKVHDWMVRKVAGSNNQAMTIKPDLTFNWNIAISYTFYLDDKDTPESVGAHIAKNFNVFQNDCDKIQGKHPYKFTRVVQDALKPLNYYILDEDAAKCLHQIYSDSPKDTLMNTPSIMMDFFGSETIGKKVLSSISDETWICMGD